MTASRYKTKEKERSMSIQDAKTPSEVHSAVETIRKRARQVKEINRRRLSKYGKRTTVEN